MGYGVRKMLGLWDGMIYWGKEKKKECGYGKTSMVSERDDCS